MKWNRRALLALLGQTLALPCFAKDPKEDDLDVNYDEQRVLPYELPPILAASDGSKITTPEQWFQKRRPEILALFANYLYGAIPQPEDPIKTTTEIVKTTPSLYGGAVTRKEVRIRFENTRGSAELLVLLFLPTKKQRSSPALFLHSFSNTRDESYDEDPQRSGVARCGVPIRSMIDLGFAFVTVRQEDLVRHNDIEFRTGIHRLFYHKGQSFPQPWEWGVIAAVAWGGSRAMDYLQTDDDLDPQRICIMGHSKMGKAALWNAAVDERFALVISAESGCAGAALWRRNYGETLEKMVTRFPYWLCRNAWRFANNEKDLPIDQHMLLACIAPRPLYVHSGVDDTWADARGEYLSAYHASEVYRMLGKKGLESEDSPEIGTAIVQSQVGYHVRAGGHSIEPYDWQKFLEFASHHLLP